MDRLRICIGDARLYFSAHAKLDPYHASELISGIASQVPALTTKELNQIVLGARWAIAGGVEQYDRVFAEFMKQQLVPQSES